MKATTLIWYRLRWPRETTPEQTTALVGALASSGGTPVVLEAVGTKGAVEHRLGLGDSRAEHTIEQFRAALPGLAIEEIPQRPAIALTSAVRLRLSTRRRPLRVDDPEGSNRSLTTALAAARDEEQLCLQWILARTLPARPVPTQLGRLAHESWLRSLLAAPFGAPKHDHADVELRNALRAKQAQPGWHADGSLAVRARSKARERQLLRQLFGALTTSQAPGVSFYARACDPRRVIKAQGSWRARLALNLSELTALTSWPVSATAELPVAKTHSRMVAPSPSIPAVGRQLAQSTYPGQERPLALSARDSLRHLHCLGPTGSGKSTLLAQLIIQDIHAGRAVVVIEPKGDLIEEVLARIPEHRQSDVVLLDPADGSRPVGLNPLAHTGRSPELIADQVLGLFHSLYAAHWGPRTHDILGASLLTLARQPHSTLTALPLLLTDAAFRRRTVTKVVDPVGLAPFWAAFETWSEQERATAIAPVMNKLRPLLMRPELRAIVGQARPRFQLKEVFTERKVLLVKLAVGQLGPEASALLGSLVVSQLWQAILARSSVQPQRRHPVFVVLDEFQSYLHLPVDLADALAQARGLGVGFSLAHQFLHQLDPPMRSAVLANAQSRVAFRLPAEDARMLAAGSPLDPEDFQSLGAYECYLQLVSIDALTPWCSARTTQLAEPTSDPARIRELSRKRYGVLREEVERDLERLIKPRGSRGGDDLTPRRIGKGETQ